VRAAPVGRARRPHPLPTHTHARLPSTLPSPPTLSSLQARERIVGWYSTGARLRPADADIHDLVGGYVAGSGTEAVALMCEVSPKEGQGGLPVAAFAALDEAPAAGGGAGPGRPRRVFVNVATEVGATEAEEVGVEHLLRDVKDAAASRLGADLAGVSAGVRGLGGRLRALAGYAAAVAEGRLPPNHELLAEIQTALSLLPSLGGVDGGGGVGGGLGGPPRAGEEAPAAGPTPAPAASLPAALSSRSTDMMLAVYAGAAVRAVLALHALVDNREAAAARERADAAASAAALLAAAAAAAPATSDGGKENGEEGGEKADGEAAKAGEKKA